MQIEPYDYLDEEEYMFQEYGGYGHPCAWSERPSRETASSAEAPPMRREHSSSSSMSPRMQRKYAPASPEHQSPHSSQRSHRRDAHSLRSESGRRVKATMDTDLVWS